MKLQSLTACALLVTAPLAAPAAPNRDAKAEKPIRSIAIAVNGDPIDTSVPPQIVGGRLLVPLREVFDALGIEVSRAGDTIRARLPTGNVRFRVHSRIAYVNDTPVMLDAPVVETNGTTFASLKLLVAVFGAQATYDQRGAKVEIISAFVGRNGDAQQDRAGGGSDVQGVVSAVDGDSVPPSITVVRGGTSRTVSIDSGTKIWTEDVTIHSQLRGKLDDVRVGDAIHAILARDARVMSVFDFYKSNSGTIAALAPQAFVLGSGRVVTPTGTTEITLGGAAAKLADLKVGDYVTVRSNPETGELRQIVGSRPAAAAMQNAPAGPVAISAVSLSTHRPLRGGETLEVVLRGTPGGRASFDIGDYLVNLGMNETSTGNYVGRFTVPDRFNVAQVPVYANLSARGGAAQRMSAPETFSAATLPPRIEEVAPPPGQAVNNVRPNIYATFAVPTEIAINVSSIRLKVNGHDVTSSATRTGAFVTYTPGVDFAQGPVQVVVRVSDAAGNTATKSWTFSVKVR